MDKHPSQAHHPAIQPPIYPSPKEGGRSTDTVECHSESELEACVRDLFAQRLYVLSCCRNPWCALSKSPPFPPAETVQKVVPAVHAFHAVDRGERLDQMERWYRPPSPDDDEPADKQPPVGRFDVPLVVDNKKDQLAAFSLCPSAFQRTFGLSKDDGYSYIGATKNATQLRAYFTQLQTDLARNPDTTCDAAGGVVVCTGQAKKMLYPKYKLKFRNDAVPKHVFCFYWDAQFPHIKPGTKENNVVLLHHTTTTTTTTTADATAGTTADDTTTTTANIISHDFIKNPELDKKGKRPIRRNCQYGDCKKTTHWTCQNPRCRAFTYNVNGTNVRGIFYCKDHHDHHKEQQVVEGKAGVKPGDAKTENDKPKTTTTDPPPQEKEKEPQEPAKKKKRTEAAV